MPGKVRTRTMDSEGFSPDDWIDLLEPFEEHPRLTKQWPNSVSSKDYLRHEDNQTGGNPTFAFDKNTAYIYLEYSPYLRAEYDVMLVGDVYSVEEFSVPDDVPLLSSEDLNIHPPVQTEEDGEGQEVARLVFNEPTERSTVTEVVNRVCSHLSSTLQRKLE